MMFLLSPLKPIIDLYYLCSVLVYNFCLLVLRIILILFAFPQTMTPQLKHFNLKLAKVLIPDMTQEILT